MWMPSYKGYLKLLDKGELVWNAKGSITGGTGKPPRGMLIPC